jgi:hypothetical protein
MSNTTRWIFAILLILFAIGAAVIALFSGGISTIGCQEIAPDWIYYILVLAAVVNFGAGILPAIIVLRKAESHRVVTTLVLGLVLDCITYSAYLILLGKNC